jgi:hypothetical protein
MEAERLYVEALIKVRFLSIFLPSFSAGLTPVRTSTVTDPQGLLGSNASGRVASGTRDFYH